MDNCEWVIDTCVLYQISDFYSAKSWLAMSFLSSVLNEIQHKVAIDEEGRIKEQYDRCIRKPEYELQRAWWIQIQNLNKLTFHSGNLSNKHTNYLIRRLRFHNDDLPFVGVANKTEDKLLVAEESDYTSQVREYLKNNLQVQVMSIEEADNHASQ